ncbi:hypothetical protein [Streptomyces sp. DSM 15324]|uniref:hypothetical protein n=1 Tax=Streptomyces sp. DSM 15324 TaxID=1739111 RepID=UPI00131DA2EA|nr:hypothetical protein [Streptomyces sp. DSM 15324]
MSRSLLSGAGAVAPGVGLKWAAGCRLVAHALRAPEGGGRRRDGDPGTRFPSRTGGTHVRDRTASGRARLLGARHSGDAVDPDDAERPAPAPPGTSRRCPERT